MKRKLAVLLLIPILIMAVDLNESATFWTHDEGFFRLYRQIQVRALNVDDDVIIWGKECELPSKVLIFGPYDHVLITQFGEFDATLMEYLDETDIYLKGNLGSSWSTSSISGFKVNDFSSHDALSVGYVVAATEAGVFHSTNGGVVWNGVKLTELNTYITDAVLGPVHQSAPGFFYNDYYAATLAGVYTKTRGTSPFDSWEHLPAIVEDQDFEGADPGNLDSLPEGWTQSGEEDEYRYVRLDTLNSYSGDYSLLIHSSAVGGADVAARYELPDLDYLVCNFQFMPTYHSGVIEIKNGYEIEIAYRFGEMAYYTPNDGWVVIERTPEGPSNGIDRFNEMGLMLDFDEEIGILTTSFIDTLIDTTTTPFDTTVITPSSIDTVELYQAGDLVPEVVFSTEFFGSGSGPYWVDDFKAEPLVYSLAPHPDSIKYVYAATPLGIYEYDGGEWSKSLDIEDSWIKLETDLEGNYLVAASPGLVYISDDQGANWDNITGAIPAINDIYVDTSGVVYAATDSFPYKYDGSWTMLNNGFLENGVMDQVKVCEAITLMGPDTVVVGNHNGIYVSVDGGDNWFEDNEGIEPYPIDSAIVAGVDAYFEDAVPSDSTTGLLDLLTNGIGPVPDVDGDTHINVVLLDIYEDGDDATSSYFDPLNEEPVTEEYSNGMEIIYVDVDDVVGWRADSANVKCEIARNLTNMIEWNYDEDEKSWIVNGYEEYGVYLANLGADSTDFDQTFPSPPCNLLLDRGLEYLWIQYLRGEFGDNILTELNLAEGIFIDPQTGNPTTRKLQGREAIDTILVGETPGGFVEAFKDWGISCYMDSLEDVKNITFSHTNVPKRVEVDQPYYSAQAWRVFDLTNPLVFSGNDQNDFNLHIIKYKNGVPTIEEVDDSAFTDVPRNLHEIDLDSIEVDSFDVLVEVISSAGTHAEFAFYNLSRDQTVDTIDIIGMLQSPLADRYLRLYYYTAEDRLLDAGVEGANVAYASESAELTLMTGSSLEGYRVYYGDIEIPVVDATVPLIFSSEDISGNQYIDTVTITVKSIGVAGGFIAASDNSFRVDIPAGGLDRSYHVTASNTGNGYYIGPGVNLNVKAIMTVDVSGRKSGGLSLYRKEGDNWVEIPCVRKGDKLEAEISSFGEFKVMEGDLVTNLPTTLELSASTFNSYDIRYAIPERGKVRLDVYNALGQRVKSLVNGVMMPGFYAVRWNGQTENGGLVGNGVYFYRLSAAGNRLTKKIVVVR
jgi:hypothetical protein